MSWLAIGHLTLVPFLAVYLAMVGGNSWVYHYSFWNDAPPTDRADAAAVASLWGLVVVAAVVGVFGWAGCAGMRWAAHLSGTAVAPS